MSIVDTSLGKDQDSAENPITTTSLISVRYCIAPIPLVEAVMNILVEMDFLVEIKGCVCLGYAPFPSQLQQKMRDACLVITLVVFQFDINRMDIMDFIDIIDTQL